MPHSLKAVLNPEMQRLFHHFAACFNTLVGFWDEDLNGIYSFPNNREMFEVFGSSYCKLVITKLYGMKACLTSDQQGYNEARRTKKLVCFRCHIGLIEMTKPVFIRDRLIGFGNTGQFRSDHEVPARVMEDWCKRYPPEPLQEAYLQLHYLPESQQEHVGGIFSTLIDYMVQQHMISLPDEWILTELLHYLEANTEKTITLNDLSRYIHKSPFTISHLFTKQLGQSFKHTQIDLRLQKAEAFMRDNPHCTVSETAAAVGYDDPLYFSRIYKKRRNRSPSDFLKGCRGQS